MVVIDGMLQAHNILIKLKAHELKGPTTNLLVLAQRIVHYAKWHRLPFYCLQLALVDSERSGCTDYIVQEW